MGHFYGFDLSDIALLGQAFPGHIGMVLNYLMTSKLPNGPSQSFKWKKHLTRQSISWYFCLHDMPVLLSRDMRTKVELAKMQACRGISSKDAVTIVF